MRVIWLPFPAQMHVEGNQATFIQVINPLTHEHRMFPPGLEPGTFHVLGKHDNHYTTETDAKIPQQAALWQVSKFATTSTAATNVAML